MINPYKVLTNKAWLNKATAKGKRADVFPEFASIADNTASDGLRVHRIVGQHDYSNLPQLKEVTGYFSKFAEIGHHIAVKADILREAFSPMTAFPNLELNKNKSKLTPVFTLSIADTITARIVAEDGDCTATINADEFTTTGIRCELRVNALHMADAVSGFTGEVTVKFTNWAICLSDGKREAIIANVE